MEKTISYNGKKLSYQLSGEGPCVVLLHGFGEDGWVWQEQVAALEKTYKVLVPDLPGSGKSELVADMSMEGMAQTVISILDQEGIATCTLIGHSMGGYITLAFAELFPNRLTGFGLFHSTATEDSEEKIATRKKGIRFIQEHGAFEFLKTTIPNLYGAGTKENNPKLIEDHIEHSAAFEKEALIIYYESMIKRPDRIHILEENKLPILFVLGKEDVTVPLQDGLKQSHLPLLSYIHILNGSGHMGMREEPEESNKILAGFLTNLQKGIPT